MSVHKQSTIRPAQKSDVQSINHITKFGAYVHQHSDWRRPSDWIEEMPFFVAEWNYQLVAALSCSADLSNNAWVRLFAVTSLVSVEDAWKGLWGQVRGFLYQTETNVAVIAFQKWFKKIIVASSFQQIGDVILLERDNRDLPPAPKNVNVSIRNMLPDDIHIVHEIDRRAFEVLWQHSPEMLELALSKSSLATVAEIGQDIIGYQISTAKASSGHLARLAVLPEWQGKGVGYALIHQMISTFSLWGTLRFTVNTQADNYSSIALYQKVGFHKTETIYPVFMYLI